MGIGRMAESRSADLERRLSRRRAIESLHHKGRQAHGRGDFILRHYRLIAPILKTALRLAGLYGRGLHNARHPQVRHVRLRPHGLPAAFSGFRILLLADLHIDGVEGLPAAIARELADLPADVCLLAGDYRFGVDGAHEHILPLLETALSTLRTKHGTFAVLGNHDCSGMAAGMETLGIRLLVNERQPIEESGSTLWIGGVDDPHYFGCDDLEAAFEGTPPGAFKLLLAHSPELFREAGEEGVGLYLAGHTHGGQVRLPRLGAVLVNAACPRAYTFGVWRHGRLTGYTSAGVGSSLLPVRYYCPPEITLIELEAEPD